MKWVRLGSWSGEQVSLLDFYAEGFVRFWGTVKPKDGKYQIMAYTPSRELQIVEELIPSLEEAQEAVEKFLFDSGTLQEGDIVEYEDN